MVLKKDQPQRYDLSTLLGLPCWLFFQLKRITLRALGSPHPNRSYFYHFRKVLYPNIKKGTEIQPNLNLFFVCWGYWNTLGSVWLVCVCVFILINSEDTDFSPFFVLVKLTDHLHETGSK